LTALSSERTFREFEIVNNIQTSEVLLICHKCSRERKK
jgi:hypothetical protein